MTRTKKFIRKPKPAQPNFLHTFKPKIHELVPELANLTEEEIVDNSEN